MEGDPFRCRGCVVKILFNEKGVYGGEHGVQPFQINDGISGQGRGLLKVVGTEIHDTFAIPCDDDRQAMGAADEGAIGVKLADMVMKEGAGSTALCRFCHGTDLRYGVLGHGGKGCCQVDRLDPEDADMQAAPTAAFVAGYILGMLPGDVIAECINFFHQSPVIGKKFRAGGHGGYP